MRKLIKLLPSLFFVASATLSNAQGTYGDSRYFNFTFDSLSAAEKTTSATTGAVLKVAVDSDSIIFGNCSGNGATRNKGSYLGAVRSQYIEFPMYSSLGYFSFYLQNGSSGTTRNLNIKYWDTATSTWITTETLAIGGNVDQRVIVSSLLSKKAVKVRIESDSPYFWFHQIEAWSSKLASTDPNEAPKILSFNPVAGSVLTSSGTINVQFDEFVKAGSASSSLLGTSLTSAYVGNTLQLTYSGFSQSSTLLTLPANVVKNAGNIGFAKDSTISYLGDIVDPVYQSVSPVDGSKIHVNNLGGNIVLTFNENIAIGSGTITFGPAVVTPTVSGNTLVLGYAGLAYSTAYTLSVPAGMIKDLSGNTYKNVINIAYTTNDRDATAPTLASKTVADGAVNLSIGGSIAFVFNEIVQKQKNGVDVTMNGSPVVLSFNGKMMGINYTNLDYNTEYTVNIPSGAVSDTTDNSFAGISFKFNTKQMVKKAFDFIVAKDGSGSHTTIQAAINAVTDNSTQRTFIYVKNGVYTEKVLIPATKQNVSLIGQDSASTILTYNDYAGGAGSTDASYTIDIKSSGFYAENITIKNTWNLTGGSTNQAVALMTEGDQQVFKNVRALSFQDTHYPKVANTRNYYLNCFIEGATDFMFGSSTAFFESSTINCVLGGQFITAPSGTTKEFGLVYNNCTIKANANVPNQQYYLGRPWKDEGKTVWLNTKMGPHIRDIGWAVWSTTGADADNHLTGYYGEYNSMDLTGTPINPTRATWGKKLTAQEASRYTIDNVFNYGVGSTTWNPLPYSTETTAPANVTISNGTLSWDEPKFAVGYVVFRNDSVLTTTTSPIVNIRTSNSDVYKIKAVNEYGAQSNSALILTGFTDEFYSINDLIYPNPFNDILTIKNADQLKTLEFYNVEGMLIKKVDAATTVKTDDLKIGMYLLKLTANNGKSYSTKLIKR